MNRTVRIGSSARHNIKYDNAEGLDPKPGDVFWIRNMKFENHETKDRPIIIVKCSGNTVQYLNCTSQSTSNGYFILDLISAGLDRNTYVSLIRHTMEKSRMGRKIGHLSEEDIVNLGL